MKGIILAGGAGTRLHPATRVVSKQLLPLYDKPMIFYPLSTLMLSGIREILIISTPRDLPQYRELLGDGRDLGLTLSYKIQDAPRGLAEAFILGREFLAGDDVTMILGDNVFYSEGLSTLLQNAIRENRGATVFGYQVRDPERYGVAEFTAEGTVSRIVEKPTHPPSNYAITGLYVYTNDVVDIAANLRPSQRGELEITDINNAYLAASRLKLVKFGRGTAWLDTGTHDSLLEAANFVATIEHRQGLKLACLEEVAWRMGFIQVSQLLHLSRRYNGDYRTYLERIADAGRA